MKKAANDVDRHVGGRVRMRRMLIGMSQEKLGDALGLTFQQVQKYEKGTNRISASRLQHLAGILGVGIDFFYDGAPGSPGFENGKSGFSEDSSHGYSADLMNAEGLKLLRAFQRIGSPKVRRKLVELAVALEAEPEVRSE
ncbi:helix-turn-helix transcriptional regulator [Enterovirga sp.]|jgi:transcriptional regulator with XRE-family HTH domain|uniref:helix-turn-helix domain-containing protein n=1 Tax=Enterovirga sp. TaxID=2026350 RepID=UPI0026165A11|nr:helix-turn-helix transcriptional regulator [Enterovirga sp.]MDB5590725.1 transcriptional regulator [Enterovirga sp.]